MQPINYSAEQKRELVTKAKELKASGRDFRSIAKELGINYSRLYGWIYPEKKRSKKIAQPKKRSKRKPSLVTIPVAPMTQERVIGDLSDQQKVFLKKLINDHRSMLDGLEKVLV